MTRFRELRLQRGLSQEQLCRIYNEKYNRKYTTAAMSFIEHDKRSPELGALMDFADFYGVSLDYLLGREHEGAVCAKCAKVDEEQSVSLSEKLMKLVSELCQGGENSDQSSDKQLREVLDEECDATKSDKRIWGIGKKEASSVLDDIKMLDGMAEYDVDVEMLCCTLKQSIILAKRIEQKKTWYKY